MLEVVCWGVLLLGMVTGAEVGLPAASVTVVVLSVVVVHVGGVVVVVVTTLDVRVQKAVFHDDGNGLVVVDIVKFDDIRVVHSLMIRDLSFQIFCFYLNIGGPLKIDFFEGEKTSSGLEFDQFDRSKGPFAQISLGN